MMNKWRILVIMILAASLVLIFGAAIFHWNPLANMAGSGSFRASRPFPIVRNNTPALVKIPASFLATFLCSVITLYLFPRHIYHMSEAFSFSTEILRQVLLGFLFFILIGIATVSATLSVFTIPFSTGLLVLIFLSSFVGVSALCLSLGRWMMERAGWIGYPLPLALGLGLVILYALFNLPFIGIFLLILIACLGLGVTVSSRFGTDRTWNISSFIEEEKK